MTIPAHLPTFVLSERLEDLLNGRRVRTAVFTTYSFDPGFFELEVLPLLFGQAFDHRERLKRVMLEDALRTLDHVAVYYDRSALSQDASPAQLDFRRYDLRRSTGVFHAKLVLLLVENEIELDGETQRIPSLLVGVLSANLTRGGWWENVEAFHFEEIPHKSSGERIPFRRDLLFMLDQLKRAAHADDDHAGMEAIRQFLLDESTRKALKNVRVQGRWYTRLFAGQRSLPEWLEELKLGGRDWNLEIISPFFDGDPEPTLEALIDALRPREIRVYLPLRHDGAADLTASAYECVEQYAYWATLPSGLVQRSAGHKPEAALPRYVHAKVYRLWNQEGQDVAILGSVNCTRPAHSAARSGNLEAAFLVDLSSLDSKRRWWLKRLDEAPEEFAEENPSEDEELQASIIDLSLRYDWMRGELSYRYEGSDRGPIEICHSDGPRLHPIEKPQAGRWIALPESLAEQVAKLLQGSSFLLLRRGDSTWRVLVREEGVSHRPSLLEQLTPEEILRFWSLLTPEQRASFIEQTLVLHASLEGLAAPTRHQLNHSGSLFDRFAGLYHAFGQLEKSVRIALDEGRPQEVVERLLGAKYDSLPVLLQRRWEQEDGDPVQVYLTFLCARQLWERVRERDRKFARSQAEAARELEGWLRRLPELRERLDFGRSEERDAFLDWFEPAFLRPALMPEERA